MPEPTPASTARAGVDAAALARQARRLAAAPEAPWLHTEVARRMAERLGAIRLQPEAWLEWGATAGGSAAVLRSQYPRARRLVVEPTAELVARHAAALWPPQRWRAGADQAWLPADVPAGAAQLLWSNMGLHGQADLEAQLATWHRAIAVDGFLMFSTLGPDTLRELRELHAEAGWGEAMAPLVDMHDLGDMLVHAGFADPVMDQETITLTWSTPEALLDELRGLGGNAASSRFQGLRTPRWLARWKAALAARAGADGRIAMRFELVYGHAFRPPARARVAAQTQIPLEDLRQQLGRGRRADEGV